MMKKTLLTLATVVTASFLSMAADCSGSNIVDCTGDEDCTVDGQVCVIAEGEETGACQVAECADDVDCDLSNTGSGSPIFGKDQLDAGNDECEDEEFVTIVTFDGTEVCAVEVDDASECDAGKVVVSATSAAGGNVDVCANDDGVCDVDTATCG